MKNLLLALTLLFSVQLAAQTKEVADAIKNYEKAKKSLQIQRRVQVLQPG
jgi:hypothetical protein